MTWDELIEKHANERAAFVAERAEAFEHYKKRSTELHEDFNQLDAVFPDTTKKLLNENFKQGDERFDLAGENFQTLLRQQAKERDDWKKIERFKERMQLNELKERLMTLSGQEL